MRYYRFLILSLILCGCKTSQVTQSTQSYKEDLSLYRIEKELKPEFVNKDEPNEIADAVILSGDITAEIDSINAIIIAQNKERNIRDGFTIQVYVGDNRGSARNALAYVEKYYPDLESKITYRQPDYRVKTGAFYERLEATRIYNEIKTSFPKAILLPEKHSLFQGDD